MNKGYTLAELIVVLMIILIILSFTFGMGHKFFSQKNFNGTVTECSNMSAVIVSPTSTNAFSFAVDMDVPDMGTSLTFSSEDRKFATIRKGDSIKVKVFKYPPWNWEKAGTYYGGRLLIKYKKPN